ncbi:putative porin [Pararhodonellum marinum]|uniref:putative porin n=1 Tax=Pararhodonellum marinum TaxID=2755358 RepID=UPI00293BEA68|nr:putative porin [Pararhodonellum marinum]
MKIKYFLSILMVFLLFGVLPANAQTQGQQRMERAGQVRTQQGEVDPDAEETGGRRGLIDDSTQMVYGPNTTLIFREKQLRYNRLEKSELDTSLVGFHNFEPVADSWYKYQDLGNIGSAAKPVFYEVPELVGRSSGFHVYDLHYNSPDSMVYYDTKSPFTNLESFFGGGNRNMLNVNFARNVTPNWNVGLNFNTIRARKVLNPNARDDNMVEQTSYSFHTNYRSENGKYILLANFSRMRHFVNEQGGIIPPEVDSTSLYFAYEDAKMWLRNSTVSDLRQDYHVFHQYEILKGWQVYHVFDKRKQEVTFKANLNSGDSTYFNFLELERLQNQDTTTNFNNFSEWRNEVGFKGDFGPVFYNAFVKFRTGRMANPFFESNNNFTELSIGGALRGEINENWYFEADGEYLIPDGFRVKGAFRSPYLDLTYTKALYKPTLMQLQYSGNHFDWNNDFSNIGVDQIKGVLKADFKNFRIRPNLTLNRVNNYVFFNEEFVADQINQDAFMVIPAVEANLNFGKKYFVQSEVIYTLLSGGASDKFRIPEWLINSRVYFEDNMFNDNLFIQIGFEARHRSDNFAEAYLPMTQQFYLQNNFNVFAYTVFDAFVNVRINRTRVLFRYNHLNANLNQARPGYFVTPGFTGLPGMLDLGISWYFFD